MRKLRSLLLSWRRGERGVSAIEFAIIAPVMVTIFFACVELSILMQANRKTTAAASTLGDLAARTTEMTNAEITEIFAATELLIAPFSTERMRLRLSSVAEDEGQVLVQWSRVYDRVSDSGDEDETAALAVTNWSARAVDSAVTVPAGVITTGGTLIYAEVEYDFMSEIGYFLMSNKRLREEFFIRPRRVEEIPFPEETNPS